MDPAASVPTRNRSTRDRRSNERGRGPPFWSPTSEELLEPGSCPEVSMLAAHPIVLALLVNPAPTDVIVVAPVESPGADFFKPTHAVDSAQDGDIILIRPGNYDSFTAEDKDLTVVGDVGGNVTFNYTTELGQLSAG